MHDLISKENSIFEILQEFIENNLEFIIVGGYAVSSYKHRFSIDADIVIKEQNLEKFTNILKKKGFKQTINKELENIYGSQFVRYEKDKASIDFLINALACRQTQASFSYNLLLTNSLKRKIIGIEKEITALVPRKEMLIITKIHSARLTDLRDIVALARGTNLELIQKLLFRGNKKIIKSNLEKLQKTLQNPNFIDSFKGVFIEKKFDVDLDKVKKISELRN